MYMLRQGVLIPGNQGKDVAEQSLQSQRQRQYGPGQHRVGRSLKIQLEQHPVAEQGGESQQRQQPRGGRLPEVCPEGGEIDFHDAAAPLQGQVVHGLEQRRHGRPGCDHRHAAHHARQPQHHQIHQVGNQLEYRVFQIKQLSHSGFSSAFFY